MSNPDHLLGFTSASAIHKLSDVLITHVPQVVPVLKAFRLPAGYLRKQFAPIFERLFRASELAIDRDILDVGLDRLLIGVQPTKLKSAFVVTFQIVMVVQRMVIQTDCAISI